MKLCFLIHPNSAETQPAPQRSHLPTTGLQTTHLEHGRPAWLLLIAAINYMQTGGIVGADSQEDCSGLGVICCYFYLVVVVLLEQAGLEIC